MRHFIVVCLVVLSGPTALFAQTIGPGAAVPAVANLPGVGGTFWQSDVVIHNISDSSTTVRLLLFPEIRGGEPAFEPMTSESILVPALSQTTLSNVVLSEFGLFNAKGALSVISEDGTPVVVGSRTYTFGSDGGSYGQEVFGNLVSDTAWAAGARHDSSFRTNLGIYLPTDPPTAETTAFTVSVRDDEGTEIATGSIVFNQAGLQQVPLSAFGVDQLISGSVSVECSNPDAIWYGYISRVDQISGDAVYRPLRGLGF
jgi:hypothetical protein